MRQSGQSLHSLIRSAHTEQQKGSSPDLGSYVHNVRRQYRDSRNVSLTVPTSSETLESQHSWYLL